MATTIPAARVWTLPVPRGGEALTKVKDPDAVLPFALDVAGWLAEEGTTLSVAPTITITPEPAGSPAEGLVLVGSPDVVLEDDVLVVFWLSDGVAGATYDLAFHFVFDDGREDDRTRHILVRER